jgi:hypothetical protein
MGALKKYVTVAAVAVLAVAAFNRFSAGRKVLGSDKA